MPTHEETERFRRDYRALSPAQRASFKIAVEKFVEDLRQRAIRAGLRVKGIQGAEGIFEITWAADGRATFQYGDEIAEGEPHVIWRRIGTHDVLRGP